jgi:serine protease Do
VRTAVFASVLLAVAVGSSPTRAQAPDVGDVFRQVAPSVVMIRATGRDVQGDRGAVTFTETGSGVIVSADGKVMTAAHVVHAMDEITVESVGGDAVAARVVASEPAADLSLLQLERLPAQTKAAPMANSDASRVGDQILVVGAPYGLHHSLSVGWISARWPPNTVYKEMPLAEFFQTDAVINTGNSGGPMFNTRGEVVGVVSHNISKSGGSEGLGFVVTLNTARDLLLEKRSMWSGLEGRLLTQELADVFNIPAPVFGYLVKTVAKGSPAEAIGLRGGTRAATIGGEMLVVGGDIVLSVDGIGVNRAADLAKIREHIRQLSPGAAYTLTILRAGRVMEVTGRAQDN